MNRILSLLIGIGLLISSWVSLGITDSANAEVLMQSTSAPLSINAQIFRNPIEERFRKVGTKIDLNNSSVLAFRRYRGLYPTLASKIIENAPFEKVEDVLEISGLSDHEKEILKANLDNFIVLPPEPALIEGQDRINPGIYK